MLKMKRLITIVFVLVLVLALTKLPGEIADLQQANAASALSGASPGGTSPGGTSPGGTSSGGASPGGSTANNLKQRTPPPAETTAPPVNTAPEQVAEREPESQPNAPSANNSGQETSIDALEAEEAFYLWPGIWLIIIVGLVLGLVLTIGKMAQNR